jgi:hypothetical protein
MNRDRAPRLHGIFLGDIFPSFNMLCVGRRGVAGRGRSSTQLWFWRTAFEKASKHSATWP